MERTRARQEEHGGPRDGQGTDPWRERRRNGRSNDILETRVTPALGWFSIGLGLAEILAPGAVARFAGVADTSQNRAILRLCGGREIGAGIGILARPRPAGWVWSRVAGDAIDLSLLGAAYGSPDADKKRLALSTALVLGVTALDAVAGADLTQKSRSGEGIRVRRSITIGRSPEELYAFWRDFENLPRFMAHLESVTVSGDGRSHWVAKAPAGTSVEWDADVVEDQPNRLIAWRSTEESDVPNAGTVRFEPAPKGAGTEIHVDLRYDPPGGIVGSAIATLFGEEPDQQVFDDLRRLKQVMEIGEIVKSDASIHAGPHPAQPAATAQRGSEPAGEQRPAAMGKRA